MATRSTVAVKDTGTAEVGTLRSVVDGITTEYQAIVIVDGTTPTQISTVRADGRIEFDSPYTNLIHSYTVTIATGTSPTLILNSSNRVKLTLQSFSLASTNATIYLGGSTLTSSTGYALLDGNSKVMERMKGSIYGILDAGTTTTTPIRVFEERYE